MGQQSGPLDGLRVVDCTSGMAGPRATGVLADFGADVIWVEPPGGDRWRHQLRASYSTFNRGKRSVTLSIHDRTDREALLELIGGADLFVTSWRDSFDEQIGFDFDTLHERFPSLVKTTISGFGLVDGTSAGLPGYESLVHAVAGSMAEQPGFRDGPIYVGLPFASIGAAQLAALGSLAAVCRRDADGHGRHVETSLLDGALAYLSMMWADTDLGDREHTARGRRRLVSRAVECGDGEYLGVHTGAVGAFGRLMEVLGLDEHFPAVPGIPEMGVELTDEQREILESDMLRAFASEPRHHWLAQLLDADICAIPELHACEVFDESQPLHNEMILRIDDPVIGAVDQVAPPARFAGMRHSVTSGSPTPGQHHEEVMADLPRVRTDRIDGPTDDRPLLDGLRVLDFASYYAGPYSTRLLADLGADVIKVEPTRGDQLRGLDRPFWSANAGKRSLAIDLKSAEGGRILGELIRSADVLQHNLRPGVAERLGIAYDDLREVNPRLVYAYSPGWGASGPDSQRQSFAPLLSGYVGINYEVAGEFNPPIFPLGNEDPGAGLVGAVAIVAGLYARSRTGVGGFVEHPQLNAAMTHLAHVVRTPDGEVMRDFRLDPLQMGFSSTDGLYETADGWIVLVAGRDRELRSLAKMLDIEMGPDVGIGSIETGDYDRDQFEALLRGVIGQRATSSLVEELRASGVAVAEPVGRNALSFLNDPDNHLSQRVGADELAGRGAVRQIARLVRCSAASQAPHRRAPLLGEHTDELLDELGFGDEAESLRVSGVVVG